jgi:hypothetical protein
MPLLLFKGVLCMMCLFMAGHAGLGEVHLGPTGGAGGGSNGTRAWGYLTHSGAPWFIQRRLPWGSPAK